MPIAVITGSGTYALPGFESGEPLAHETPYGTAEMSRGQFAGSELLYVSRHGPGHSRLSNHVNHRANIWALRDLGATAVIGCTACGAVDPTLELGDLIVFDDMHFISNRLPDGSLCTFFDQPGQPGRGHWVLHGGPYSPDLRSALLTGATQTGNPAHDGGVYGHVDGPRFNTPAEIDQLARSGVAAVSQTGGPETTLCGELELPFALMGYVTDYANGVIPGDPTPIATLTDLISRSPAVFADVLSRAVPRLFRHQSPAAGTMLRFDAQG